MTDTIALMEKEHENISELVRIYRAACCSILEGSAVNTADFRDMIYFARNYADHHHHGKKEKILFREMSARLGHVAENLIRHGMLVEHDMGRFHTAELEKALDRYDTAPASADLLEILAHAAGWADLLERHISKENEVVYTYAERALPADVMENIQKEIDSFEAVEKSTAEQSLLLLRALSRKYPA